MMSQGIVIGCYGGWRNEQVQSKSFACFDCQLVSRGTSTSSMPVGNKGQSPVAGINAYYPFDPLTPGWGFRMLCTGL